MKTKTLRCLNAAVTSRCIGTMAVTAPLGHDLETFPLIMRIYLDETENNRITCEQVLDHYNVTTHNFDSV